MSGHAGKEWETEVRGVHATELESEREALKSEQRDREAALAELERVRAEMAALEAAMRDGQEQTSAQALRVAELSEAEERLQARLRGCSLEIERLSSQARATAS